MCGNSNSQTKAYVGGRSSNEIIYEGLPTTIVSSKDITITFKTKKSPKTGSGSGFKISFTTGM